MPERVILRILAGSLFALALVSCAPPVDGSDVPGAAPHEGSEPFMTLIQKARDAAEDGDVKDAQRLLDQARGIEPENPGLWVDIARLRYRRGEHLQAVEAADYALDLDASFAPALLLRAQLVRDAYGLTDALPWFKAAVNADPGDSQARLEYAATLGDAGYNREMLRVVRGLSDTAQNEPRALFLQAVLAARAGQPVLAKSLLERSGMAAAGVPSAMMLDALIGLQERNFDSAADTLQALAQRQPGNERIAELLARALWMSGRDGDLIDRFAVRARDEDVSPYLIMLVARAMERQGDRASAAPLLERAYAGRKNGWATLPELTDLPAPTQKMRGLIAARQFESARNTGVGLRNRYPGSGDIAALAGDAELADGNYKRALQLYRDAARIRRPWPLTRKAAAAYRDFGDPVAADALIARHLAGEPRNTEALLLNAEAASRSREWLRVAMLLDHAIELGAGNDPRLLKLRAIAARNLDHNQEARRFERMTWDLHPGILPQH